MIYVLLAILSSSSMTFVMRYSENNKGNRYGVTAFNYMTGVVISYSLLKNKTLFFPTMSGKLTLALGGVNAILFVSSLLLIQYSIRKNGASLTTTFNRLGILIPTIASALFFHEIPNIPQLMGLSMAIFSIVFISGGKKDGEARSAILMLIGILVIGGCSDFNSKIFGIYGEAALQEHFIFYTFVFASIISIGILLCKNRKIGKQDIIVGIMVGIPNQLTALCLLKAVAVLPAFMVFPVFSAAVILVVNIVNQVVFKEKLSRRQYIGTGGIALALVLINL